MIFRQAIPVVSELFDLGKFCVWMQPLPAVCFKIHTSYTYAMIIIIQMSILLWSSEFHHPLVFQFITDTNVFPVGTLLAGQVLEDAPSVGAVSGHVSGLLICPQSISSCPPLSHLSCSPVRGPLYSLCTRRKCTEMIKALRAFPADLCSGYSRLISTLVSWHMSMLIWVGVGGFCATGKD